MRGFSCFIVDNVVDRGNAKYVILNRENNRHSANCRLTLVIRTRFIGRVDRTHIDSPHFRLLWEEYISNLLIFTKLLVFFCPDSFPKSSSVVNVVGSGKYGRSGVVSECEIYIEESNVLYTFVVLIKRATRLSIQIPSTNDEDLKSHHDLLRPFEIDRARPYYAFDESMKPDVWFDPRVIFEIFS
ncbi:hypothetical protein KIN20_033713 [Parelaphostrongylus tenuis]|uniref:DNA ligase n=1 Tax=Parelaphostrongylus tenuis TaxID=148309 RepID=A0AAD5WIG7_PARTN|nr:hypothetical protein KIN20_033713 [Parelaphostrongylus tenuis]